MVRVAFCGISHETNTFATAALGLTGMAGDGKIAPSATVVKQLGPHPRPLMPEDDAVEEHRKQVVANRKALAEAEEAAAAAAFDARAAARAAGPPINPF